MDADNRSATSSPLSSAGESEAKPPPQASSQEFSSVALSSLLGKGGIVAADEETELIQPIDAWPNEEIAGISQHLVTDAEIYAALGAPHLSFRDHVKPDQNPRHC